MMKTERYRSRWGVGSRARNAAIGVLAAAALLLSGCGQSSGTPDAAAANDAATTSTPEPSAVPTSDSSSLAPADSTVGDSSEASSANSETDSASSSEKNADSNQSDATTDFEYEEEVEPAKELAATLCNLDADYFRGLRSEVDGEPVADDQLRMGVLALGDNLTLWNGLESSYPDVVPDIERAQRVYDKWDEALLAADNGDADAAAKAMQEAEAQIDGLPRRAPDEVEGCVS